MVSLDDENVDGPEMPTTGPPRIIPIEEVQNAKKEILKNRKTFIMSIIDKNKNKKAKKPKILEEEEPEEIQIEEEPQQVQVPTLTRISFSQLL
jgi:hypothetical protein